MGVRIGRFAAALGVIACAGCGVDVDQLASPTMSVQASPTVEVSTAPAEEPPYVDPSDELRDLATRFVTTALGYDAWTDEQRAFLGRLGDLATKAELQRLRHSGRAHLRWWVLRQRLEQTTVHVTGVSQSAAAIDRVELEVEAVLVTRSTVSTVRDFVDVTLVAVSGPGGWRVDRAEGGGL